MDKEVIESSEKRMQEEGNVNVKRGNKKLLRREGMR